MPNRQSNRNQPSNRTTTRRNRNSIRKFSKAVQKYSLHVQYIKENFSVDRILQETRAQGPGSGQVYGAMFENALQKEKDLREKVGSLFNHIPEVLRNDPNVKEDRKLLFAAEESLYKVINPGNSTNQGSL